MGEHVFNMRLKCNYSGEKNSISDLEVEHRVRDRWRRLDLSITSPGFDIFVYSALACQHTYFRINCAERGLLLAGGEGHITLHADDLWKISEIKVHFTARLASGSVDDGDVDYITSRMKLCPVSLNLGDIPSVQTTIDLQP